MAEGRDLYGIERSEESVREFGYIKHTDASFLVKGKGPPISGDRIHFLRFCKRRGAKMVRVRGGFYVFDEASVYVKKAPSMLHGQLNNKACRSVRSDSGGVYEPSV